MENFSKTVFLKKISLENDHENILSRVSKYPEASLIQTICYYLGRCEKAGEKAQDAEFFKRQETAELEKYLKRIFGTREK